MAEITCKSLAGEGEKGKGEKGEGGRRNRKRQRDEERYGDAREDERRGRHKDKREVRESPKERFGAPTQVAATNPYQANLLLRSMGAGVVVIGS